MNPTLSVNLDAISFNSAAIKKRCDARGTKVDAVLKGVCCDPVVAQAVQDGGIHSFMDSRMKNIIRMKQAGIEARKGLLRIPMMSELDLMLDFCEWALVSMPETIRAIEKKCKSSKRRFEVLLMTDLGDLREGVLPDGIAEAAETLSACEYVSCIGLGTNLGCFGGVLPSRKNMEQLIALSDELRTVLNAQEWIVSGGGSQVYYEMAVSGTDVIPLGITHVRPGGVLLRGKSGADCVPGLRQDTMRIDAEYVEIAKKPSKPFGNIGMDAFGNTPDFEDRGVRMRGIVALGRQDVVIENLKSLRAEVEILGGSSDHMILDIDALGVKPQLGDIESFAIDRYGAMLQAFTSEFVEKRYVRDSGVGFSE